MTIMVESKPMPERNDPFNDMHSLGIIPKYVINSPIRKKGGILRLIKKQR